MDCAICWDEFENSAFSLNCGHIFHRQCIQPLTNERIRSVSCPICRRTSIFSFQTHYIREVFFTTIVNSDSNSPAPTSTNDSLLSSPSSEEIVSASAHHEALTDLRTQNQRLQEENADAHTALQSALQREATLQASILELQRSLETTRTQLKASKAKHTKWEKRAKELDLEVMQEIDNADDALRERDEMKREVRKMKKEVEVAQAEAVAAIRATARMMKQAAPHRGRNTWVAVDNTFSDEYSEWAAANSDSDSDSGSTSDASVSIASNNARRTGANNAVAGRYRVAPIGSNPNSRPKKEKKRELEYGRNIRCVSDRRPRDPDRQGVPKCTDKEGHDFSGKGSNRYQKKHNCSSCAFDTHYIREVFFATTVNANPSSPATSHEIDNADDARRDGNEIKRDVRDTIKAVEVTQVKAEAQGEATILATAHSDDDEEVSESDGDSDSGSSSDASVRIESNNARYMGASYIQHNSPTKESVKDVRKKLSVAADRDMAFRTLIRDMETALNESQREVENLKAEIETWKKKAQEPNDKALAENGCAYEATQERDSLKREMAEKMKMRDGEAIVEGYIIASECEVHKHFVREVYLSTSPKAASRSTRKDPISKWRTLASFRLQNKRLSEEISDARKQLESAADRDMALLTSIRDLGSELEVSRSSSAIYKAKYAKWRKMAKKSTTDLSLVKRERDVLKVEINRLKRRLALDDSS
ncbi:hypothetical protein BDN70DRAFT_996772 [Pholiota conissans]|uniref:RING-type domain-containing protein n=1 Tax=Pholiota conissans TaxID=109636 RepID=A0A9P5YS74_9AGAR|nr:hypothetical protein BDN70DRAFT_996772 [Pholiota conissans]